MLLISQDVYYINYTLYTFEHFASYMQVIFHTFKLNSIPVFIGLKLFFKEVKFYSHRTPTISLNTTYTNCTINSKIKQNFSFEFFRKNSF